MGCASAKHVATVQNEEEAQKGKNYQNGDVFGVAHLPLQVPGLLCNFREPFLRKLGFGRFDLPPEMVVRREVDNMEDEVIKRVKWLKEIEKGTDEYRIKPVEEVKYMKNGAEEEQKIAARNQENLEKSASSNVRLKTNKEIPGLVHQPRANMHISESQQEFFRMLDEKIEKGRDYCSEEEDIT
ncbi:hypothetical protein E5288_WYG017719 [Bos mutus]|uniref:Uncharacterized protein n=1 Tax=Bos mutus TaxID=72004 RepID=A0A6B0RBR4_9CETA|nr:hypothetical protein [Bos mutus]